jgi:hypothetical protein
LEQVATQKTDALSPEDTRVPGNLVPAGPAIVTRSLASIYILVFPTKEHS